MLQKRRVAPLRFGRLAQSQESLAPPPAGLPGAHPEGLFELQHPDFPIAFLPVLATLQTASITCSAIESSTANSILAFGSESMRDSQRLDHGIRPAAPGRIPVPR